MNDRFTRLVDGVEVELCWRFTVSGRSDATFEPARSMSGPFDPDRQRCLRPGETFKRLDPSGHPCTYRGHTWCARPAIADPRGRPAENVES